MDKKLKKYIIKNVTKKDMITSLKKLDKMVLNYILEENNADSVEELAEILEEDFETCLSYADDDFATRLFMSKLIENEGTNNILAYDLDIEKFYI